MTVVVYALENAPESYSRSIFLAGPTPRTKEAVSWRGEAIKILQDIGYDGVVFVPEDRSGAFHGDYMSQVQWEEDALHRSDVIVFWVPREMTHMPAMTTNVEFGAWADSGKIVLGAPQEAPRNKYLFHYADQYSFPASFTLEETLQSALDWMGPPALRAGGERDVPLMIWHKEEFQQWLAAQYAVGNRLGRGRKSVCAPTSLAL